MGTPSFTRSKRYTLLHNSFELIGRGSLTADFKGAITLNASGDETLHPTGDLNASPDGTFHVKADTDFNDKSLTGVQGGNVLHFRKDTISYTDLTATSYTGTASQDVALFTASPGDIIFDVTANLTALFGGAAVENATKSTLFVGDLADPNGFGMRHTLGSTESVGRFYEDWGVTAGVGADKGAYLVTASVPRHKIYATATVIKARICASTMVASLTAGAVDIYTAIMSSE